MGVGIVDIPDDNGTSRKIRLLRTIDGDFHLTILNKEQRANTKSVRICDGNGNPRHRELHSKLLAVFKEAERLGYISED